MVLKFPQRGLVKFPFSPYLNLKSFLFVPVCPSNLISLSQLTKSLNCSITFDVNYFVIQDRMGLLIGEGHELRGLYYLGTSPHVSCFASHLLNFYMIVWDIFTCQIKKKNGP